MASNDSKLEVQLKEVGDRLLDIPSSVHDLLYLLDKAERLLVNVEQAPSGPMQDALLSPMTALISRSLLKHSDSQVKISVASCLSEITRITAPDAPYNDEQMKEIFELIITALGKLSNVSNLGYEKAVSVLCTVAKVKSCLLMLDLELDELILDMFRLFVRVISYDHSPNVYQAMETIMTIVIKESEDISFDFLLVLLSSVRKEVQNVSPRAWKLGTKVMTNCAAKLKKYLQDAVRLGYVAFDDYGLIVSSISQDEYKGSCDKKHVEIQNGQDSIGVSGKEKGEVEKIKKKRGRKPKSMKNPEEGYEHSWISPSKKSGMLLNERKSCGNTSSDSKGFILTARKNPPAMEIGSLSDDGKLRGPLKDRSELDVLKKQSSKYEKEENVFSPEKSVEKEDIHEKDQSWMSKKTKVDQNIETVLDEHRSGSSGDKEKYLKKRSGFSDELAKPERKRRRKMKENSSEMAGLDESLLGRRIRVWWPMDKTFYEGVIDDFDPVRKRHLVLYADGDSEVLNLAKQRWELIGSPASLQGARESTAHKDVALPPSTSDENRSERRKGKRRIFADDSHVWTFKTGGNQLRTKTKENRTVAGVHRRENEEGRVKPAEASAEENEDEPFTETDAVDSKAENVSPHESKEGTPDDSRQDEISGIISDNGSSGNTEEVSGENGEL